MHTDKCFFVVPTFNTYKEYQNGKDSRTVCEVLKDLIAVVKENLRKKQEILIINDGSYDNTERKLLDFLKPRAIHLPERGRHNFSSYRLSIPGLELGISIQTLKKNRGLNVAVLKGYKMALERKPDFIIKLDSDGQHDPSDFPKLLERIKVEKLKFANISTKLGFLIMSYDALKETINEIEKFAIGPETRGIDRKTKSIIKNTFGKNAVKPN